MTTGFDQLLAQFKDQQHALNASLARRGVDDIGKMLAATDFTVRVVVAPGTDFTLQASSVQVLDRLIDLGRTDPIDVAYASEAAANLSLLLPGFAPGATLRYRGVALGFTLCDFQQPLVDQVFFAVTGGMKPVAGRAPNKLFNAIHFLELQPFDAIAAGPTDAPPRNAYWHGDAATDLAGVAAVGGAHFDGFAFKQDVADLDDAQWQALADARPQAKVAIARARALCEGSGFRLLPADGLLHTPGLVRQGFAFDEVRLFCVLCAAIARVQPSTSGPIPTVVALTGSLAAPVLRELPRLWRFVSDNQALTAQALTDKAKPKGAGGAAPSAWNGYTRASLLVMFTALLEVLHSDGERLLFCVDNDAASLDGKLAELKKDKGILLVGLQALPPPAFEQLMTHATLPFIFNGDGYANLALNLGKPFLRLPKNDLDTRELDNIVYRLPMMPPSLTAVHTTMSAAVLDLCGATSSSVKEAIASVQNALAASVGGAPNIEAYFALLASFYHADDYDKLVLSLRYAAARMKAGTSGAGAKALKALYAALEAASGNGVLALLPGAFGDDGSPIAATLTKFFGSVQSVVSVVHPQIAQQPDGTIDVTGSMDTPIGKLAADIHFAADADTGAVTMCLTLAGATFSFEGAPWFSIGQPALTLRVGQEGLPCGGAASGTLVIGSVRADLHADFPTAHTIVFRTDFGATPPSVESLFQLLGGIDLTASLPPPLNLVTGLTLLDLSVGVDLKRGKVAYFKIDLSTTPHWNIVGDIHLDSVAFSVTVDDPAGARAVSWTGDSGFSIDQSRLDAALVYPGFAVTAGLAADSVPLSVSKALSSLLDTTIPVPVHADITGFGMSLWPDKPASYAVDISIASHWPLPGPSVPVFTVDTLQFHVRAEASAPMATISGHTQFFEGKLAFGLDVQAEYGGPSAGWTITGVQDAGEIQVSAILQHYLPHFGGSGLPDFEVSGFSAEIHTGGPDAYYVIGGNVELKVPFLDPDFTLDATARIVNTLGTAAGACSTSIVPSATIDADCRWHNIDLRIGCAYTPGAQHYTLAWGDVNGSVVQNDADWVGTLNIADSRTLGSMVETFVSWATGYKFRLASPWNLLDEITLVGLTLIYDFTQKTVGFKQTFDTIDLGFAQITSFGLTYDSKPGAARKVAVQLGGTFPWSPTPHELAWDATDPATTPTAPGKGNGFFDLRMLAMGQHINIANLGTTVEHAIATLTKLPDPSGTAPPPVRFSDSAGWVIGADFGLLGYTNADAHANGATAYACTVQFLFDDPALYGLRLALDGPPAKVLGGLDFEILYRKVSDTLGVYQAELTLPKAARTIQTGVFTIQLPTIAVAVYTNGDFKIDVGFPWNNDFSRSFTVQAIVPPGIPLLGAGGFYFGKLSSASSNAVPQAVNGTFDPVIVFGFGAQVGLGKSIAIGPLSAAFSLTLLAVIEGVLARWNPYAPKDAGATLPTQIDGTYYYSLDGTFGVAALISGSVDFVVIKASVNLAFTATAHISFAAYAPIVFTVQASLDVRASLKIDLGLFSITLYFHFSADLTQTFSIQAWSDAQAPWRIAGNAPVGRLDGPLIQRLSALRRGAGLIPILTPDWDNLTLPKPHKPHEPHKPPVPVPLKGYLSYALTAAGDAATELGEQLVCYVAMLVLDGPQPPDAGPPAKHDTSFDTLCKLVARWVVAAFTRPATLADIDNRILDDDTLAAIADYLQDTSANPQPIDGDAIEKMLGGLAKLTLSGPDDIGHEEHIDGVFFPMPTGLALSLPAYGGAPAYGYAFDGYNTLAARGPANLRRYFDQLALQVEAERPSTANPAGYCKAQSVAGFVFADYFLMIARQGIAALRAGLRTFKYQLPSPKLAQPTAQEIVDWINSPFAPSDDATQVGADEGPYALQTVTDLFRANAYTPLSTGVGLTVSGAAVTLGPGDSLAAVATRPRFGGAFDALALAERNKDAVALLQPGVEIGFGGRTTLTQSGDTLGAVAARLGAHDFAAFVQAIAVQGLFQAYAAMVVPDFSYLTQDGDTLNSVAAGQGLTVAALGMTPANGVIAGLFAPAGGRFVDVVHVARLSLGRLLDEAKQTGAWQNLAGMVSRFHLHGLRLPTADITANAAGMWVTGPGAPLPRFAGLYALTGQQFAIPPLTAQPWTISMSVPVVAPEGSDLWIVCRNGGTTIGFTVSGAPGDANGARIETLRGWVSKTRLATGVRNLGAASALRRVPASFGLGSMTRWNAPVLPTLPFGSTPADAQFSQIWHFPVALSGTLDRTSHAIVPRLAVRTYAYDEAARQTVTKDVANYGWASTLAFRVTRPDRSAAQPTYALAGIGAADVALLEDIVAQLGDTTIAGIWIGYGTGTGIRTGAAVSFGIGQCNLSTQTNPGAETRSLASGHTGVPAAALNGNAAFLTLLWESAITADGGFYLYYTDGQNGLPDMLFDEHGNATLTLVVVYGAQADNRVADYTNAVVFNDPIGRSAAVVVEADPQPTVAVQPPGQAVAAFAAAYYTDLADLAWDNRGAPLTAGARVVIERGTYLVSPTSGPGGQADDIARHFGTTEALLALANPRIDPAWWAGLVPAGVALRLPPLVVTVGTDTTGATLSALAAYYGCDPVGILADNAAAEGLFAGPVRLAGGPLTASSTLPAGSQLFRLQRPAPTGPDPSPLLETFSMLGYQIDGTTPDFTASHLGVPVGPLAAGEGTGKLRIPCAIADGAPATYDVTLRYASLIKPPEDSGAYAAIGRLLQVEFSWLDLYGNTIMSDLSGPQPLTDGPVNCVPTLLGYTDTLVALGQWPSVNAAWRVVGATGGPTLQVTFSFDPSRYRPDLRDPQRDTAQNAKTDLDTFTRLAAQMADAGGFACTLSTSLTTAPTTLGGANLELLNAFLADIEAFLVAVAGKAGATPPADAVIRVALTPDRVNPAQVFELACSFTLARTGGIVDGDFAALPGIRSATTALTPDFDRNHDASSASLRGFAHDFETAFGSPRGTPTLKVMTGPDRFKPGTASSSTLWAVRIGAAVDGAAIHYAVDAGAPVVYAPAPVSNALVSRSNVPVCPYVSGHGIDRQGSPTNFSGIDVDVWVRQVFAAVDRLLSPAFVSALLILDKLTAGNALVTLQAHKLALAAMYRHQMQPVFRRDASAQPDTVQELFRQTMLARLGNAYTTQAAVQLPTCVSADIVETPPPFAPPALYGQVVQDSASVDPAFTFTNAKLPLTTAAAPLAFLVATPGPVADRAAVRLPLAYRPSHVEHQIGTVPGIDPGAKAPYLASSWLQFVIAPPPAPSDPGSLAQSLGTIDIPLLLRAYPAVPDLPHQQGDASYPNTTVLGKATQWDYAATYSLPMHYPQDTVHVQIAFNVTAARPIQFETFPDAFDSLAQFATVYPAVQVDLDGALAGITERSTDTAVAMGAIGAVNAMLAGIVGDTGVAMAAGARTFGLACGCPELMSATDTVVTFTVRESAETVGRQDRVLVVTVQAADRAPEIAIEGFTATVIGQTSIATRYAYTDAKNCFLLFAAAQTIAARTIRYPELQVMAAQDAQTSIYISRNDEFGADDGDGAVSNAFIYRTPAIRFVDPLQPSLVQTGRIDIARLGQSLPASLQTHLARLFGVLGAAPGLPPSYVQLTVSYGYALNPGVNAMRLTLPVLMQPPLLVSWECEAPSAGVTGAQMAADLARAIETWFGNTRPSRAEGCLHVSITVMSSVTATMKPLLTLNGLFLELADIASAPSVGFDGGRGR